MKVKAVGIDLSKNVFQVQIAHQSAPQSKIGMNSLISSLFASGC
jgi:hypothetical protein